jgi:hypothetical protein
MPVTPFVYEFFLFNSLYDVDWETRLSRTEDWHIRDQIGQR